MAITFTWSVKDMHRVAETGAVYRVEWSCSGVDADTEVSHSRSGTYNHKSSVNEAEVTETYNKHVGIDAVITSKDGVTTGGDPITESATRVLTPAQTRLVASKPDHTASGFTAYADLTEADVLAWCKADGEGARTEALITKSINSKIAASANSTGMPWAAE